MDAVEGGVQEGVVEERQRGGDCLKKNSGCDPWTLGESHPTGCPRDPSPAQPTGPALPPRPARAARRAPLPTCPYTGRLQAAGLGWASCRGSPPPRPHRAYPCALGWRAYHRSSPDTAGITRARRATEAEEQQRPRRSRCRTGSRGEAVVAEAEEEAAGLSGVRRNGGHALGPTSYRLHK